MFPPEILPSFPLTLEQAIARMEGWYAKGSIPNRPQRNNNPGDIEFGEFAQRFGSTQSDGRFAIFPSAEQGWNCLKALLRLPSYAGLTLQALVARYAPAVENDDAVYASAVAHWTGRQITEPVIHMLPPLPATTEA